MTLGSDAAVRPDSGQGHEGSGAASPIVEIRGIRKRFPIRRGWKDTILHPRSTEYQDALHDVSLTVGRGEFFGLLGRNGAGKTTLFKILATLILPDEGTARVDGIDVEEDPGAVRRRLVPVIPYERSLYWRLSATENLRLYAALHGYRDPEARSRVDQTLEVVGLTDVGSKQVGLFSTGMRQRLLVARALLSDPDVLLLDEPTRSLDPVTARDLRAFLREEINEAQGCTVLLATHDADEVRELCHRVGILDEGRLLLSGPTDELLHAVGEHSYRIVGSRGLREALETLRSRGLVLGQDRCHRLDDTWWETTVEIPGGREAAARVLRQLLDHDLSLATFAEREVPLAELIETAVRRAGPAIRGAATREPRPQDPQEEWSR